MSSSYTADSRNLARCKIGEEALVRAEQRIGIEVRASDCKGNVWVLHPVGSLSVVIEARNVRDELVHPSQQDDVIALRLDSEPVSKEDCGRDR